MTGTNWEFVPFLLSKNEQFVSSEGIIAAILVLANNCSSPRNPCMFICGGDKPVRNQMRTEFERMGMT
jgi:hypothetical protein